ncbi:DUF1816 domain-containing protein, partial [Acaryochloris marina NIES-2412]|uniref:DUF1816 domain-containing protein n=1 Tax=Acaryochloris marina TaxID=155978 RepID=UPI00405983D7
MILQTNPSTSNTREPKAFNEVDELRSGWWLEIGTANPPCINYYGPYKSQVEADAAKQDAEQES